MNEDKYLSILKKQFQILRKRESSLWILSYTSFAIILNYYLDLEVSWIDSLVGTPWQTIAYFFLYLFGLLPPILLQWKDTRIKRLFLKPRIWIIVLLVCLVLSLAYAFPLTITFVRLSFEPPLRYLAFRITDQMLCSLFLLLPVLIAFVRGDTLGFKLRFGSSPIYPYFAFLALAIPSIFLISYLPSFQESYPQFWPITSERYLEVSKWLPFTLWEIVYLTGFLGVEFFFRGALIFVLRKELGDRIILPQACLYTFIHFGKPPLETISSFVGGFLLGTLSYRTRTLAGGILVHMSIAASMDFFAILQKFNLLPEIFWIQ